MSARAYRINYIDEQNNPSFNLWHDEKLMDFFNREDGIDSIEQGILEIPVITLEKAIKQAKELEIDEDDIQVLKEDIQKAKDEHEDYIKYMVY